MNPLSPEHFANINSIMASLLLSTDFQIGKLRHGIDKQLTQSSSWEAAEVKCKPECVLLEQNGL